MTDALTPTRLDKRIQSSDIVTTLPFSDKGPVGIGHVLFGAVASHEMHDASARPLSTVGSQMSTDVCSGLSPPRLQARTTQCSTGGCAYAGHDAGHWYILHGTLGRRCTAHLVTHQQQGWQIRTIEAYSSRERRRARSSERWHGVFSWLQLFLYRDLQLCSEDCNIERITFDEIVWPYLPVVCRSNRWWNV